MLRLKSGKSNFRHRSIWVYLEKRKPSAISHQSQQPTSHQASTSVRQHSACVVHLCWKWNYWIARGVVLNLSCWFAWQKLADSCCCCIDNRCVCIRKCLPPESHQQGVDRGTLRRCYADFSASAAAALLLLLDPP